jgi:hypothetical protein
MFESPLLIGLVGNNQKKSCQFHNHLFKNSEASLPVYKYITQNQMTVREFLGVASILPLSKSV